MGFPDCECAFASRLRSGILFKKFSAPKIENKTVATVPRSLTAVSLDRIKHIPWRKLAMTGAVAGAGFLTSAAVVSLRRRQKAILELSRDSVVDTPLNAFDRLDTILNTTSFNWQGDISNHTSILVVFDSNVSKASESKIELRKDNINLISTEIAKATAAGENVRLTFKYNFDLIN
jgi:hypothetical protein